ncbi:Sodium transport ATPase 5, partial [Tolypocladium capitatum]
MGTGTSQTPSVTLLDHVSGQSNRPLSRPAHSLTSEHVLRELRSDAVRGLEADEAARRVAELGPNELDGDKGVQPLAVFLEQIFNAMTLVLLLALAASFGIQAWIEGGILAGIIVLNVFIGFAQTLHAEKTIDSLRTLGSPTCSVVRGGDTVKIRTADVVPGDIVDLSTGDSVPADIRLVEAVNLEADEALLTGESAPVSKSPRPTFDDDTGPGDRLNVVYSSTIITKGRGRGVVFATGMFTEIGLIARALHRGDGSEDDKEERKTAVSSLGRCGRAAVAWLGRFLGLTAGTPLQRKLSQLFLGLFSFAVVCAVVVLGTNKFDARQDVVLYAVTTAIGTIPVSLLLVLTVTMAAGTKKMVERHVIVRNLQSLEALGGVTNICSDKTGTITQGRMVVRRAWLPGCGTFSVDTGNDVYDPTAGRVSFSSSQPKDAEQSQDQQETPPAVVSPLDEPTAKPALWWYLNVASLANLATLERTRDEGDEGDAAEKPGKRWTARGAPTEIAIEVFAARFGWNRVQLCEGRDAKWRHVAEFPFDSDVKMMSVLFRETASQETHGAVERVLDSCGRIAVNEAVTGLTASIRADVLANMEALAGQGLRVLALAHGVAAAADLCASD